MLVAEVVVCKLESQQVAVMVVLAEVVMVLKLLHKEVREQPVLELTV
jgi:hypothetical protein|tara:strand:- start:97 stop:237 length:141 start_codon:yes stop_codon:yes gene_type:complete